MAKYQDTQGNVIEVSNPELNPQLTQGRTLVTDTTPLGKVTSTSLSRTEPISFQTQPISQPYNIASLGSFTPMQATPQENEASEVSRRIRGYNEQLAGQSAFRAEQEQQLGIPELTRTQRELESRLTALKNESLAIPLQVQQDFQGRGATRAGVQPIQTGKLRENAIQALTVNSLLEASRGNLTLAQDMVDRAVAQKYDPIKEQIAINTANLDLILNDPAISLADKNRAEQQKLINEQRASAVAKQEADDKEILKIGTAVASAGAPATVIDQIRKAQSPLEAVSLASPYLGLEQQLSNRLLEEKIKSEQFQRFKTGSGGGSGVSSLAQSVFENPQLFNSLPPSTQAQIIPQLSQMGFNFPAKLSAEQQKVRESAISALQALTTLESKIIEEDGSINRSALIGAISGLGTTAFAKREIKDVISRIRTGAALTANEEAFYEKQVPRAIDNEETIKTKLNHFKAFYAGLAGTPVTLEINGNAYEYDNLFDPLQREEVRKALQAGADVIGY